MGIYVTRKYKITVKRNNTNIQRRLNIKYLTIHGRYNKMATDMNIDTLYRCTSSTWNLSSFTSATLDTALHTLGPACEGLQDGT